MGRKKGISAEQRRRWELSAVRREDSMVSLSREAGVTEQTLYRWRDLFIEGGCERLNGGVSPEREEIERLKKELAERDQVIGEQTIAICVLKKTWESEIDGRVQSGCHGRAVACEGEGEGELERGAVQSGHCAVFVVSTAEPWQAWSEAASGGAGEGGGDR